MNIEQYIQTKKEELTKWENEAEKTAAQAGGKVKEELAVLRTKRDDIARRLDALRQETTDRVDVLRMGIESAWDEIRVALATAAEAHPNAKLKS
jgi:uncharacterized coiled-coil DUF342 family protein